VVFLAPSGTSDSSTFSHSSRLADDEVGKTMRAGAACVFVYGEQRPVEYDAPKICSDPESSTTGRNTMLAPELIVG